MSKLFQNAGLLVVAALCYWPTGVRAECAKPQPVRLHATVPVGVSVPTFLGTEKSPFIVPPGKRFILNYYVLSDNDVALNGYYLTQLVGSTSISAITATSSTADPASLHISLLSGVPFAAGDSLRFFVVFGPTTLKVTAYGYLVDVGKSCAEPEVIGWTIAAPADGSPQPLYQVPKGAKLLLTDVVVSPQVFVSPGEFKYTVGSTSGSESKVVRASGAKPSSFVTHLWRLFQSGEGVTFALNQGSAPVNVSAYGYLIRSEQPD